MGLNFFFWKKKKQKKLVAFSDMSPFQRAWYGMWRKPGYTKEEVLEINKDFLEE